MLSHLLRCVELKYLFVVHSSAQNMRITVLVWRTCVLTHVLCGHICCHKQCMLSTSLMYGPCVTSVLQALRVLCSNLSPQYSEADVDCSQCLELQPNNVKALYRRALARKVLYNCTYTTVILNSHV